MKFCSGGMLAATGVKMSDSEKKKEQEHVRHFLHKTCNQEVSGRFTLQSRKTTAKKCTKNLLLFFFFYRSRCLHRLALYDFIFCLIKL